MAQLFERQVARTPDAIAVVSAGRSLTYCELDRRSNQLARHLRALGVQTETLVGIAVERSLEMMVGLIAILKAGGAYVPIDPSYPMPRIELMIEDSQAPVILATERTKSRLPHTAKHIVSIDGDAETIAAHSTAPISSTASGNNLAYAIYTSGSTGKPKGVMIEHRNVVNFFTGMDQAIGSDPGVWLAVTSISFDISVLELFWTLTRGFQVIIHGDEGVQTIPDEIRKYGVTHMQSTPSLARMIAVNPDGLASLGRLKKLFLGGEALPPSLVRQLRQVFSGEMYNMYGPTETTIWSTTFRIGEESDVIPIGKPIVNTQVYVLDAELRPVAAGETGDLWIGGEGVVRGYWQRPELTAEKFRADPFRPGNRMYRTGDIARFLPDGNLEFLGTSGFPVEAARLPHRNRGNRSRPRTASRSESGCGRCSRLQTRRQTPGCLRCRQAGSKSEARISARGAGVNAARAHGAVHVRAARFLAADGEWQDRSQRAAPPLDVGTEIRRAARAAAERTGEHDR